MVGGNKRALHFSQFVVEAVLNRSNRSNLAGGAEEEEASGGRGQRSEVGFLLPSLLFFGPVSLSRFAAVRRRLRSPLVLAITMTMAVIVAGMHVVSPSIRLPDVP
ncbi:hypothetical protein ACJRO7_002997 [Eucalyptus globulus]|uniref:Uncharacterized protein n=1 Tax=Eucalyptus globulus TaxID=34317 RepID=A0ABD3IUM3_EUCGL